jgi:DNA-binding winged helix-turn-helix (wHTH) protein
MPFVRECGLIANTEAPWPSDARYLRTGPLLADLCYRCIECDGTRQELQQRVFDLLLVFLAKPNALHTRAALFQRLWPGVIVEDANLSQSIWLLRKALGKRGKYWIRTVAKGGYVFEPPGPVEWLAAHPDETSNETSADASVETSDGAAAEGGDARDIAAPPAPDPSGIPIATSPPPAPAAPVLRTRRPRWPRRAAAAALVAAAALLLGLPWLRARQAPAPASPAGLAIAVIEVEDPAAAARWPARLLRDWLRWKLSDLPEVALLTEADLATRTASDPPQLVLISATEAPDDPDMVVVQARVQARSQTKGAERRFEQRGPPAKVAAMVDALSNQVMAQLVPTRSGPWPPLTLGPAAARRYAEATEAFDRRDWQAAARLLERTVELAPRFGLARLQLAQAQKHQSQASAAVVQMESALALLRPLPADVAEALQARRLTLEPARYREAEAALARLSERYAGRKEHLIERARLLLTAGEPQQARVLLARMDWRHAPTDIRIAQRLVAADIDAALGDIDAARGHAGIAERLARQAGEGWKLERAAALMDLARLDPSQEAGSARYREAAQLLDSGGDQIGAMYAQFLAESAQPPATGEQRLNALLAKAREGGYPRLEIGILQVVARRFREAGDYARSRDYLEQAWTTAQAAGDTVARDTLDLLLAGADLADLRLDGVQARVDRLSKARPQGARAMLVALHQATLAGIRGQPTAAIAILDLAERSLGNQGRLPAAFSGLNCTRASYRLITGELARAREDWRLCEAPSSEDQRLLVALGRAQTELMAGDRGAARALLEPLGERIDALPEGPDRWALSLEQAALLGRAGNPEQAEDIYAHIAQRIPQQGTTHLRAALETGLAENEAALGRWPSSRSHLEAARRLLPEDAWSYQARLRLVEIVGARAGGHDADAVGLLRSLHAQAHRRRDVGMMLEIHTLLPDGFEQGDCTRAQREHLVAQTGMRGAGTDWLAKADAVAARAPAPL